MDIIFAGRFNQYIFSRDSNGYAVVRSRFLLRYTPLP
jgi:hypothetical protein